MGIIGCYSIDLYCDNPNHVYAGKGDWGTATGESRRECIAQARRYGWIVRRDYQNGETTIGVLYAECPECAKRKAKEKPCSAD